MSLTKTLKYKMAPPLFNFRLILYDIIIVRTTIYHRSCVGLGMDVYRSKKVLFDGALRPMRLYVQNGKIIYVKDGYDLPENTGQKNTKNVIWR